LVAADFEFVIEGAIADAGFTHAELVDFETTITSCAVGIAESGTIVLDAGQGQGRRAITLIPDHHVCIIRADQVVSSLEEGLERVMVTRPLTFISGPSATSDIELVRVEGVHGPRKLEVLVVKA
jgi:L-lactate dehydrogenase complex protein LldG